jgi:type IV fimbrial biogenesis protein FimT
MLDQALDRGRKRLAAFTVLELLLTLSIATILLAIGAPALQKFSQKQMLKAAIQALHSDLLTARSEAVHRNQSVVVCPGNPVNGCAGSSTWSGGWIVFSDSNHDRARQVDEILLRHGQGYPELAIHGTAGRRTIRFLPNGSAPGSNSSITLCGLGGPEQARKLVISNLGRIRRDTARDLDSMFCPG